MNRIKTLFASPLFLIVGILVTGGGALAAIFPAADYITNRSSSTTDNFYLGGALMALLAILATFEAFLVIRLVWGAQAIRGIDKVKADKIDDDDDLLEVRSMRVTGMKKALVFGVLLAVNIIGFDQIGSGILITATRRIHVLTQLRSDDPQDRSNAVTDAIQLVGDREVAAALGKVLETPGEAREWAAYAAGVRYDLSLRDQLAELLRTGTGRERAAGAVALARFKDPELLRLAIDAFPEAGEFKADILIAMGMKGKLGGLRSELDLEEAGRFLSGLLEEGKLDKVQTRLAVWVLGQLESPQGLKYLKGLLSPETDTTTLCVTLESLGRISEAASCDDMMALFPKLDHQERCPELVAADFTGHEVLLCGGLNLLQRILREIARIGDDQQKIALERISVNESYPEDVRKMAAEIAFQMRYKPLQHPVQQQ